MEEADSLGDRIIILSHGSIFCAGTSLFLKSMFGIGYTLTFSVSDSFSSNHLELKRIVEQNLSDAKLLHHLGTELSIRIPFGNASNLEKFFAIVEQDKKDLGIKSYSLSITTLDDVYTKVSETNLDPQELHQDKSFNYINIDQDSLLKINSEISRRKLFQKSWLRTFLTQLNKRRKQTTREWRSKLFEISLTLCVIAITFLIIGSNFKPISPILQLNAASFGNIDTGGRINSISEIPIAGIEISPTTYEILGGEPSINLVNRTEMNSVEMSTYLLETATSNSGNRYISYIPRDGLMFQNLQRFFTSNFKNFESTFNSILPYELTILHNVTAHHALPIGAVEFTKANLREILNDSNAIYRVYNHPFPATGISNIWYQQYLAILASLIILLPLSYHPGTVSIFLVRERECKSKYLQRLSGLSILNYWIPLFIWDLANFALIASAVMLVIVIFDASGVLINTSLTSLFDLQLFFFILIFGGAAINISYVLSAFFKNPRSAQISISGFHFVSGFVLILISYILDLSSKTENLNSSLKNVWRVFPSFNLGEGLVNLSTMEINNQINRTNFTIMSFEILGRNFIFLAAETLLYFCLLLMLEKRVLEFLRKPFRIIWLTILRQGQENAWGDIDQMDIDVLNEANRVLHGTNDALVFKRLSKIYSNNGIHFAAVDDISVGISKGECFGLLGSNGAGKSTTIRMICGDEYPTSGEIFIHGKSNFEQSNEMIGYCPQIDPLISELSPREHLVLFAVIRGIPASLIDLSVDEILQVLGLLEFSNRPSGTLSGGNKRKLSLGISLIGNPGILILDEPTSAMDPVARRHTWEVIHQLKKERSILLTTHSMEECESLCDRIGIMKRGKIRCLGSIQHLKSRFGGGCEIQMQVKDNMVQKSVDFIRKDEILCRGEVKDAFENNISLYFARPPPLSELFGAVERNKESLGILFYNIGHCSIEQVFFHIINGNR